MNIAPPERFTIIWGRPAPEVERAIQLLRGVDLPALAIGRHALDGEGIVAIVEQYTTRPPQLCRLEAHRKHHDIQIVLRGRERIGLAPLQGLQVVEAYDEARDVAFFEGEYETIVLNPATAAIFSPHDAHAPQIAVDVPELVRKVVVKVRIT